MATVEKGNSKTDKNSTLMELTKTIPLANASKSPQLGEIAIEASQIVSRLEQVAEGIHLSESNFNQSTVFLGLDQRSSDDILQIIQALICTDEDGEPTVFPLIDDVGKLVITSYSIAAYCSNLDRHILQKLSTRFTTDITRWISSIFGDEDEDVPVSVIGEQLRFGADVLVNASLAVLNLLKIVNPNVLCTPADINVWNENKQLNDVNKEEDTDSGDEDIPVEAPRLMRKLYKLKKKNCIERKEVSYTDILVLRKLRAQALEDNPKRQFTQTMIADYFSSKCIVILKVV